MRIHSLKFRLTIIMATVITIVVALICLCNYAFFEKYYINDRVNLLRNSYEQLKTVCLSKEYDIDEVEKIIIELNSVHSVHSTYIDNKWHIVYSSKTNNKDTLIFFQEMIFNQNSDIETIEENKEYSIVKNTSRNQDFSYLEIYGTLEDGSQLLMQITLDSIEENMHIFNRFVLVIGIIMLVIGIIVIYFIADKFTKPVNELSNISRRMSDMDFSVKYTGNDKSEIGVLGHSMNAMSVELEKKITELKEANIELKKDIEIKDRNEEMRREFLSNVSHELKTPLAIIQGYAEGLKEGINDDRESFEYYCDVIMDEAGKMNSMVKKLLTLNQLEFGNEPVILEKIELSDFIASILKANMLRMEQKDITVVFEQTDKIYVMFDSMQLEEVFVNYLSNAINHCEGERQIRISICSDRGSVKVSVFNTGKNIPKDDIDRIWEKFYKVDKARTREYGGNGIGLSIVKAILDKFNAQYGVQNHENGVEFWFSINN